MDIPEGQPCPLCEGPLSTRHLNQVSGDEAPMYRRPTRVPDWQSRHTLWLVSGWKRKDGRGRVRSRPVSIYRNKGDALERRKLEALLHAAGFPSPSR